MRMSRICTAREENGLVCVAADLNSYLKWFDTQMGVDMIGQLNRGFERSIAIGTFERQGERGLRPHDGSFLHLCGRSVECDLRCRCRRYFFVVV